MREQYEKQINELTTGKNDAEAELKEVKVHLASAENKNKEQTIKITQQTKEIDTLKKELARVQKGFESQLKLAQEGNKNMYEEKQRMLIELRKLKDELKEAVESSADAHEKLYMVQDSLKHISILKEKLEGKDSTI